ncbi:hypothetical protein GPECTOR_48g417 [Gonium pectorale]|uniref:Uncharacterized protein n=1 Tax=Gonium pectorale TaxID=33097 RepID=A0A150G8V8_GONPE|nr:hypothetical protein GPECTOR_48g417 [Gonium pectorale]|eukprot:KXZ45985.1 hypothetical protein GPECTOR_48g417 [Gonium pectorale]
MDWVAQVAQVVLEAAVEARVGLEGWGAPAGVKAAMVAVGWGAVGWEAVGWEAVGWEAVGWEAVGWEAVGWEDWDSVDAGMGEGKAGLVGDLQAGG